MDYKKVFECHPDAEVIFVVNDMPFLNRGDAHNYAVSEVATTSTVKREEVYAKDSKKLVAEAKAEAEKPKGDPVAEAKLLTEAQTKEEAEEAEKRKKEEASRKIE